MLVIDDEVLEEAFVEAKNILPEGSRTPVELYFMMWAEGKLQAVIESSLCNTPKDLAVALKVYQELLGKET